MGSRSECVGQITSSIRDQQMIQRLHALDRICCEIEEYQDQYDYESVACNGFRTFVSIVNSYLQQFAECCPSIVADKKTVQDYDIVSQLLYNNGQVAAMIRNKGHDYPLQVTDQDCDIMQKFTFLEPKHMEPLYKTSVGPFYIRSGFKATFRLMVTVVGFFGTTNLFQRLLYLLWPGYRPRFQAKFNVTPSLHAVTSMGNINWFPLNVVIDYFNKPSGCSLTRTGIERNSSDWCVRLPNVRAAAVIEKRNQKVASKQPHISCLVLKPVTGQIRRSILLHIPGGGFVISPATQYVELMSRISRQLGICVIMPEYATAPKHPYPCALQDLIDLYLFLLSGDERVEQLFGFHPEKIILSGDSAGGQLAVVLTIALNEIRKKGGPVRMPHALSLQYPGAVVGFVASPGILLSGLDMVASIGQLRITTLAYAQTDPPTDVDNFLRLEESPMRDIMKRFNERLLDPLYNPIMYDCFEDFANIPISITACEMDSIMDHSIMIAKKWKGNVTLDVGRGLPHGFTAIATANSLHEELSLMMHRLLALLPHEHIERTNTID